MEKKEWSIQAAELKFKEELAMCHSDFERSNATAIHGIEQRNRAFLKRKLSPVELAIVSKYGYRQEG